MRAAQVALCALVGVLLAASAVLFIADENAPAWLFAGFGLFGYFTVLAMIFSDARTTTLPPPRP